MTSPGDIIARVPVAGGEARLRAGPILSVDFEVEWAGAPGPEDGPKRFEGEWDLRETQDNLIVILTWKHPPRPVADTEREPLLDALWALAPHARGVNAIIEKRGGYNVIHRWNATPPCHLIRVFGSTVEYAELGRTMQAPFARLDGGPPPTAKLRGEAAVWRFPEERSVSDEEWESLRPRLEATASSDIYETPYPWKISAPPRG